jgi:hypothetical protein
MRPRLIEFLIFLLWDLASAQTTNQTLPPCAVSAPLDLPDIWYIFKLTNDLANMCRWVHHTRRGRRLQSSQRRVYLQQLDIHQQHCVLPFCPLRLC